MWVKICANTNLADCRQALEAGADALGFVFAPSARQVNAAQVATITSELPATVETVGVFAATDVEEIASAVEQAGLTAVQLHGGVNLALLRELRARLGPGIGLIATAAWTVGAEDGSAEQVSDQLAAITAENDPALRVLIDAQAGGVSGGLGLSFDWSHAARVLARFPTLRIIVAGGLRPENVAEAIRTLRPYGVDVASGVELSKGKKDAEKVTAFLQKARGA